MTYEIITSPNPILRVKSIKTVTDEEIDEIRKSGVAQKMVKTLHSIPSSVGLAAPQVGMNMRFFLFLNDKVPVFCFNPEILESSGESDFEEGCLSCRGHVVVNRSTDIRVAYTNLFKKRIIEDLKPMESVIFQHENDHLAGILITDHKKER
jgi:peptide deformylase